MKNPVKKIIKLSVIAGSILFSTSSLQASSHGLGSDFSTGRTTQPNMFGGVAHGNPAEVGIQQNIRFDTIKNRQQIADLRASCKEKEKTLEEDYKDVSGFFTSTPKDEEKAKLFNQKKEEYKTKKTSLEQECSTDEIYNGFGMQLFSVGAGVEIGDIDRVKSNITKYKVDKSPKNIPEVYTYVDNLNGFLSTTADDLYSSANVYVDVLSPIVFRLKSGSYSFGLGVKGSLKGALVGGTVGVNEAEMVKLALHQAADKKYLEKNPEAVADILQMTTNIYIKEAVISKFYVGYANDFYQNDYGFLNVGGRVNFYKATLGKTVLPFKKYIKEELKGKDSTDTVADDISDAKTNEKKTSMVGLDLGASWQSDRYNIGIYVANLNEPSAKYPALANNCDALTGTKKDNCYYEMSLSDVIDVDETYKMKRQATIDGALFDKDNRWRLAFSYDLNEVKSPIGEKYQWANINVGYSARVNRDAWYKYLIPDWRLGINQNLTGSNITYYTAGLGLYGFNLDVMFDKRFITDSDKARGFGASMSYGFNF